MDETHDSKQRPWLSPADSVQSRAQKRLVVFVIEANRQKLVSIVDKTIWVRAPRRLYYDVDGENLQCRCPYQSIDQACNDDSMLMTDTKSSCQIILAV